MTVRFRRQFNTQVILDRKFLYEFDTSITFLQLIAEKAAAAVNKKNDDQSQSPEENQKDPSISWLKMKTPCMLPAVTDDTSSSDDDKSSKKAYPKPAGSTPKANSYTADESSLRNRAFVSNKK